ncbi:MAG: cytochrome c [Gammaproteobacteria bacterium]
MTRISMARVMLAISVALAGVALAADAVPGNGPGWTGVTNPKDVITARQELMEHIEILMEPIDTITVKEVPDHDRLRANAEAIGAMLQALPHLFPPTTNLYDPKAEIPKTLALPTIWKDFGSFYKLAAAASISAEKMSETKGGREPLKTASLALRASCDACHALYLRPYTGPKFLDSDYNFDFEKALRRK